MPSALTSGWLTDVLRGGGAITHSKVVRHQAKPLSHQGAISVVVRVSLEYDAPEDAAPRSLIAKFVSSDASMREFAQSAGLYRRETSFYTEIAAEACISVPRCFHAEFDRESGRFVLLLEDLGAGRMGAPLARSMAEMRSAIRALAAFHAAWWKDPRLADLVWLHPPDSPRLVAAMRAMLPERVAAMRERFPAEFAGPLGMVADRLASDYASFAGMLAGAPETLLHGDFHTQQIVFPGPHGGRFAVFDWQTASRGCGGQDLARIIVTCLPAIERRATERQLVQLYRADIIQGGVQDYPWELSWLHYRLGIINSVAMNVIVAPGGAPEAGSSAESESVYARLNAAAEDHDLRGVLG